VQDSRPHAQCLRQPETERALLRGRVRKTSDSASDHAFSFRQTTSEEDDQPTLRAMHRCAPDNNPGDPADATPCVEKTGTARQLPRGNSE
jgi:hypothetical protein